MFSDSDGNLSLTGLYRDILTQHEPQSHFQMLATISTTVVMPTIPGHNTIRVLHGPLRGILCMKMIVKYTL